MTAKKLWIWLGATVAASFLVLIFFGVEIYRTAPPFPEKIVTTDGETLYEGQDIKDGQNAWQSMGGQTVGSIWGHGAYIAPDWERRLPPPRVYALIRFVCSKRRQSL